MRNRFRDLFAPLQFRDFRLLWFAQIFSELGDWAGRLALAVVVEEQTHSTLLTALVTTASVLPYIGIGQLLATYANRYPRLRTIVITDLGRAAIFGSLAVRLPVAVMLGLAFLAGCMTPPFEAARNALTPLSVPRERYGDAIALASITLDMSVLLGYGAGGLLLTVVSARVALLLNAASFLASATLLSRIPSARETAVDGGVPVQVREGWHALVDDPFVRRFFVGFTITGSCAVVAESLVAVYALRVLHASEGSAGLLAAAIPAGAVMATVIARTRGDDSAKIRRASEITIVGAGAGFVLFGLSPDLPLVLFAFAAVGVLNASRIPANEVAVLRIADRERVPAFSVASGFVLGSQAVAAAVGGVLARSLGVRQTIVIAMGIAGVTGAWGVFRPPHEMRHAVRSTTTPR